MPQSICVYVCAYVCFGPYATSPARGASLCSLKQNLYGQLWPWGVEKHSQKTVSVAISPSDVQWFCSNFPVNPFFTFTSGRWLCNNNAQVNSRYAPFNVDGLKRVASRAIGSQVRGSSFWHITNLYLWSTGAIHGENSRIPQSSLPRHVPKRPASHRPDSYPYQRPISLLHCQRSRDHGLSETLGNSSAKSTCMELASPINGSRVRIYYHGKGGRFASLQDMGNCRPSRSSCQISSAAPSVIRPTFHSLRKSLL